MLTRTLPSPEAIPVQDTESPEFIEEQVDERWFYLYEWISPDELRMSVQADYLSIIQSASTPLAVVTLIAGFIGLSAGVPGVILAVLWVLTIFYALVIVILIAKMLRKSYLYTCGGNIVITDHHYVSNGTIIERSDFTGQKEAFRELEKTFRELLLEPSGLAAHIAMEKKSLLEQMGSIASGWGKIIQNLGRSRDAAGIVMVLMIAGVLYGGMMALIYFLWVFFVSIMARAFSWIAHRALLMLNNTEHKIQTWFQSITRASIALKAWQQESVSLLTDAGRGEWTDDLSGRIRDSFARVSEVASTATEETVGLRDILEKSRYKDIFNFAKYTNWIQSQVLSPITEILSLLERNHTTLTATLSALDTQIRETTDPSLRHPLILQRERLEMQLDSMAPIIEMLEGYEEKLNPKK